MSAISSKTLAKVEKAFTEFDCSAANARWRDILEESAKCEAAIEKGTARIMEISQRLEEYRGPNAVNVADALLAEDAPDFAAARGEAIEDLTKERAALNAGVAELRSRIIQGEEDKRQILLETRGDIGPAAQLLVDDLLAEAKAAAERLMLVYASLEACRAAVGIGSRERDFCESMLRAGDHLISRSTVFPVPVEFPALFESLMDKGPALRVGVLTEVQRP